MDVGDKKKQESLDVAEDSRQTDWKKPSFVAEMFKGNLAWDLIHPYPLQTEEDKKIGDDYIKKVGEVLEKYIDPSEVDRTTHIPQEAIDKLKEIGVFGMKIPKKYGGLGLSQTNYSRVCAYIGSYCASTGAWITAHQSIGVSGPLKLYGTEEQCAKFLPRIAKGAISAFGLTEPNVGSDPASMGTTAEPTEDGKHYIINGEKLWITNGPVAEIMIVMARTPSKMVNGKEKKQISAFVFETDTPGYEVVHRCDFMGIRGIQNGLLRFTNCKVPAENIIGKPGDGLRIALGTLNTGRLSIPATSAAGGKKVVPYASKWCKEREQWGAPIGKHQNTAIKLAQITANTLAMEAVCWLGTALADADETDIRIEAAMGKYFTTEMAWKMADEFVQLRGGRGYETAESLAARGEDPIPAEKALRDARISLIVEGTSEIMKLFIAREAMDTHVRQIMPFMSKDTNKMQHFLKSFLPFYASWYPKQWMPAPANQNTKALNGANKAHLRFVARTSRKLARTMFHTMAKFGPKLEREQLILGCFVDIGTWLFAMSSTLAYTDALLPNAQNKEELQDLCDLFCQDAEALIADRFRSIKHNHNGLYTKISKNCMEGKYDWMCEGVYKDVPPGYLKYMNKSLDAHPKKGEAAKEEKQESMEPVTK